MPSNIDLTVLNKPANDNMGGIARVGYFIKWEDIVTFPTLPTSGSMADAQVLVGNFIVRPTAEWRRFYFTQESAELKDELQGERDGKSYKHMLEVFHPGNGPDLLGFLRAVPNEDVLLIVTDAEGQRRVIGNERFPARAESGSATTGKATADRKGASMIFTSYGNGPAPIYNGTIDEDSTS